MNQAPKWLRVLVLVSVAGILAGFIFTASVLGIVLSRQQAVSGTVVNYFNISGQRVDSFYASDPNQQMIQHGPLKLIKIFWMSSMGPGFNKTESHFRVSTGGWYEVSGQVSNDMFQFKPSWNLVKESPDGTNKTVRICAFQGDAISFCTFVLPLKAGDKLSMFASWRNIFSDNDQRVHGNKHFFQAYLMLGSDQWPMNLT